MTKTSLSRKFFLWLLLTATIPAVLLAILFLQTCKQTLLQQEQEHLSLIADDKVKEIENYISERIMDARLLSKTLETANALENLVPAYKNKNEQPMTYQMLEKSFHQYFLHLQEKGYSDIFLIAPDGEIVLSLAHKADFKTNIYTGPYRDSGLNQVAQQAKFLLESDATPFNYYQPSQKAAAFIAAPVIHKGLFLGVVALQIQTDILQKVALDIRGSMQSREIVLVSRKDDYFSFQTPLKHNTNQIVGKLLPITKLGNSLLAATEGVNGIAPDTDYRNIQVIAASRYIPSMNWGMVVKEDLAEAMLPVDRIFKTSLVILGLLLLCVIALANYLGRSVTNPIIRISQRIQAITKDDLNLRVKPEGYKESVELAESFNKMSIRLKEARDILQQKSDQLQTTNQSLLKENAARISAEQDSSLLKERSKQSENKFRAITNQSTEGITVADMKGNYTFVNSTFCEMMGYSEQKLLQMTVFDVIAPSQDQSSFDKSKTNAEGLPIQVQLQRKNGSVFTSEVTGKAIDLDGQMQVLGTIRDITEQVKSGEQIHLLSQAIEQSPVSVMITDTEANIEYVNNAFENTYGYSADEVMGKTFQFLQSDKALKRYYKEIWNTITKGKTWQGEIENYRKNGETFWEQASFAPVLDEQGVICHYLVVEEDISLRKQQEEQILHQAHFDTLTNLPNRLLALDRLSQLLSDAKRNNELVAILFMDLDGFKTINDSMGHEAGDKLLIQSAQRLLSVVRDCDTVGRLGGDEFVVLISELKEQSDIIPVVENLLEQFRVIFKINGRELLLTTSVGIAIYPDDGNNTSELLRNSDTAMYHAKGQGRNTFSFFTEEMNRGVSRRLALEEQLLNALDRNEFEIFYQPQIDINTDIIIGAEALLRWHNPILGDVSPVEFIPVAEQTGLIIPIGQFVLTEALAKTTLWQKNQHTNLRISVNLSPRQFRDPNLVSFVEKALQQTNLSGESLELEITEGVLMSGHIFVHEALAALNQLGICIAMDDFGTGYSSLNYLRRYPFKVLKIDRSFINDITADPAARELVNATIAMTHGLNLKVIAEGVETKEQLSYLKEKDCDYAQGDLFGKPMSAMEMEELLG